MLLEIDVGPIEMVLQRVYKYILEVKNMPNHRLPHLAWNFGCKLPYKNNHVYMCAYCMNVCIHLCTYPSMIIYICVHLCT